MMKTSTLLAALVLSSAAWAQDSGTPAFTASPIRPTPDPTNRSTRQTPTGLQMNGGTIRQIWQIAYPSEAGDPVGAPEWFSSDRFDLTVRFETAPTNEQRTAALRQIFAEQLKLKAHYETRDTPTYSLVVARPDGRLGPTVRRIDVDCDALRNSWRDAARRGEAVTLPPPAQNGAPRCDTKLGSGTMISGGVRFAQLATLRNVAGRLIVDRTGLDGFYEFSLEWGPGGAPSPDSPVDPRPNIFTALQEQLGLKLEPSTTPVQVVVIDHIERPTGR